MQKRMMTMIAAMIALFGVSAQAFTQIRVMCYNTAQFNGDSAAMSQVLAKASLDDSHGFASPVSIFLFQEVEEDELPILEKIVGSSLNNILKSSLSFELVPGKGNCLPYDATISGFFSI